MNYRSKTTSMVLCFFLGMTGAHWFYLGRWRWGSLYVAVLLGTWPVAIILGMLCQSVIAIGAALVVLAWLSHILLAGCVLFDFFCLLAIHPRQFDRHFNS